MERGGFMKVASKVGVLILGAVATVMLFQNCGGMESSVGFDSADKSSLQMDELPDYDESEGPLIQAPGDGVLDPNDVVQTPDPKELRPCPKGSGIVICYYSDETSKSTAQANCSVNATKNPNTAIQCYYDGAILYERPATPANQSVYIGYFVSGTTKTQFIKTVGITKSAALSNCQANATSNPSKHVLCTYDGALLYERKVGTTSSLGTYIGYFVSGSTKSQFIKTTKISKAEALANCKLNATNNPKKKVYCTWEGAKIFSN